MLAGLLYSTGSMFVTANLFIYCDFVLLLLDFEARVAKKMANICERYSWRQQSK